MNSLGENSLLIRAVIAILGFVSLFLLGRHSHSSSGSSAVSFSNSPQEGGGNLGEGYIGATERDAKRAIKKKGLVPRVIERDGRGYIYTTDYRTDRVNLKILDGVVIEARIG